MRQKCIFIHRVINSTRERLIFNVRGKKKLSHHRTSAVKINFNGTHFINAEHVFCLTRGPTRSWRNGDARCCQLSNIADPFRDFFPFKKAPKPYLVSENRRYCHASERSCCPSARTHLSHTLSLCVCSFSIQRTAKKSSTLIQLNTDILLLASLILHASIAEITAQLLSLSYVYMIS